jgi:type IV pilus assembly protein PilB
VFLATRELREMIARNPDLESIRKWHRRQGGVSLLEAGIRIAEEGLTSLEEVARVALFD